MRQIKFRAWYSCCNEMIYINDFYFFEENGIHNSSDIPLMQFTGLKDKNGKEIYEGDYVKFPNFTPSHEISQFKIGEVFWYDDEAGFFVGSQTKMIRPIEISVIMDDIEVIGNIYENPELLEK